MITIVSYPCANMITIVSFPAKLILWFFRTWCYSQSILFSMVLCFFFRCNFIHWVEFDFVKFPCTSKTMSWYYSCFIMANDVIVMCPCLASTLVSIIPNPVSVARNKQNQDRSFATL